MLPVVPVSGSGRARYQPIWARDVAECVVAVVNGGSTSLPVQSRRASDGASAEDSGPARRAADAQL